MKAVKEPKGKILTYMGIDYGEKRIGIAFGKEKAVAPIKTIDNVNELSSINEICKVAIDNKVDKLVIGVPLTYEGKDTPKARKIRQYAKKLKIFLKLPVVYVNEYKSTDEAIEDAISFGVPKKGREAVDHISAGVILKRFFDDL